MVCWPENVLIFSRQFLEIGGMPSVCGLIDGTLINISTPMDNEEQFVDRKGNHSLNVLLVCGPDYQFVFCNSSWPGSVNDARVLRRSNIFQAFEHNNFRPFPGAVLLGDSVYPCNDWLITPVQGSDFNEQTVAFNRAHKRTRSLIERSIGHLKLRFSCLNHIRVKSHLQPR